MMLSKFLIKKSNLSQQFIQKCSVSGTAKGKGKIKTANILKRSSNSSSPKQGTRKTTDFDETIDQCLTSKSPLTFMKPKEIARQVNMAQMGLTTTITKNQCQHDKFGSPFEIGTPGMDLITLGLVDYEKVPKYALTVEDGRMLAKEYSRVLMRKHRARQTAETTMLRLKYEAIESLPEDLKKVALVPDLTPFPVNRFMTTLTPPIDGYMHKINEAATNKSGVKEKLR